MAYSTQRAVSDGTMVYLDLSIGYQSRDDIKVFFNDLPAPVGSWAWVGTTDKRISFTPAIPNGIEVLVQRSTRLDRIINVFALGAKFNNTTMDQNFLQVLYLTQEAVEGAALSDIYNDVDFHGYKIKNLGTATDSTDAITYGQVQSMSTGAYQAQLAAQTAQTASEAARDLAQKWASQLTTTVDGTSYSAKQYALNSAASATASANSAAASATSQGNAGNSATAAANSATAAAQSAADAAATAAPATELIARVDAQDANIVTVTSTANTASANASAAVTTANTAASAASAANSNANTRVPMTGSTGMTGNFTTTGAFSAGTNAGATAHLSPGSVEVKNSTGPYVDFATTDATDYTYRMQMTTSGELYFIHSSGNTVHFGTNGYVYAGSALLATGGDVNGTQWGGWLSSYLTTQLAAKASAGNTTVHSDGNNSINWNWESGHGVMRVDGSAQISLSPNVSDARLKVAIQPAASRDALCNIERIKFYSFNWKDTGVHEKFGYVAQQLKQIDPRYVHDGETLGFNDQTLLRDALRAIQQLSARVKELEGKQ